MAKGRYTEDDLKRLGLVKGADGSYSRPTHTGQTLVATYPHHVNIGEHSETYTPKPIIETEAFTNVPATEWFIKNYNVPSKKNSRINFVKNGKQLSIPSKLHAEYKKMTKMQYEVFGIEFRKALAYYKTTFPVKVQFTFIRSSKRRFDYANALQTVEDIMVENKWIPDDNADTLFPVFAPYEDNKDCPGVKIKLLV